MGLNLKQIQTTKQEWKIYCLVIKVNSCKSRLTIIFISDILSLLIKYCYVYHVMSFSGSWEWHIYYIIYLSYIIIQKILSVCTTAHVQINEKYVADK